MHVVACSGFPVPVSRYWREFEGVEISETELGIPGQGTVRRWLREAPQGFHFSLLAPKDIAGTGFELNEGTERLVREIGELAQTMNAQAVVFAAPPEFLPTRPNKAAVKKFVESLPAGYPRAVLSLSGWKHSEVNAVLDPKKNVVAAFDPLQDDAPSAEGDFAYLRLPGPAGYRSRYDEVALEKIATAVHKSKAKLTMCVFHNIDMHANATRTRELLAQAARAEKAAQAKAERSTKAIKAEKLAQAKAPKAEKPEAAAKSTAQAKAANVAPKPEAKEKGTPGKAKREKTSPQPAPANKSPTKKTAPAKKAASKKAPAAKKAASAKKAAPTKKTAPPKRATKKAAPAKKAANKKLARGAKAAKGARGKVKR